MPKVRQEKILSIEAGGVFGEEGLLFDQSNSYTIKALTPVVIHSITNAEFRRDYKRVLPQLAEFFLKRLEFIDERYEMIKRAR